MLSSNREVLMLMIASSVSGRLIHMMLAVYQIGPYTSSISVLQGVLVDQRVHFAECPITEVSSLVQLPAQDRATTPKLSRWEVNPVLPACIRRSRGKIGLCSVPEGVTHPECPEKAIELNSSVPT